MDTSLFEENKLQDIYQVLSDHKIEHKLVELNKDGEVDRIHSLFMYETMFMPKTPIEAVYVGFYFRIRRKYDMMITFFEMAFNEGNIPAAIFLGQYYDSRKNNKLAIKYYKYAVDNNFDMVEQELIMCFYRVKKYNKTIKYCEYHVINNKEDNIILNLLGVCNYHIGNFCEAKKWFEKAANIGCIIALSNLGNYYKNIVRNYSKAKECYETAANMGHKKTILRLARLYEYIFKDDDKDIYYYTNAINCDNDSDELSITDRRKVYESLEKYHYHEWKPLNETQVIWNSPWITSSTHNETQDL